MNGSAKRSRKRSQKKSTKKRSLKKRGGYSENETKMILAAKNKASEKAAEMTNTENLKCPAGKIKRAAYMRKGKSGKKTAVAAKCIKNKGAPGKAKRTILLEKNMLERYGYSNIKNKTKNEREEALKKAVDAFGYVEVIRRLVALANLNVRTNPELSNKVKNDQEMVSKWYKEAGLPPTPRNK